jgi:hypothetical protein
VESKNNTYPKKSVRFVIALLHGARNGLLFGMKSNTAASAAETIETEYERHLDFSASTV